MKRNSRLSASMAAFAAAAVLLSGCGSSDDDDAQNTSEESTADSLEVTDAWAKASEPPMSAAFGVISNPTDADVTVVAATSDVSPTMELHETVEDASGQMVMQEKEGGFVIPAGGELELEPGGNHLMMMDLTDTILAGEEVTVTLTFDDDSTFEFTAPVKDFTGADETYMGDGDMDMDMDMGDEGHDHE